jgi:hypothetical protein
MRLKLHQFLGKVGTKPGRENGRRENSHIYLAKDHRTSTIPTITVPVQYLKSCLNYDGNLTTILYLKTDLEHNTLINWNLPVFNNTV